MRRTAIPLGFFEVTAAGLERGEWKSRRVTIRTLHYNHNLTHRDHILLDKGEKISYTVRLELLAMGRRRTTRKAERRMMNKKQGAWRARSQKQGPLAVVVGWGVSIRTHYVVENTSS